LRNVDENFLFDLLTWPKARHPTPPRFFRERQPRNKSETIQNFLPVCTAFQDVMTTAVLAARPMWSQPRKNHASYRIKDALKKPQIEKQHLANGNAR